jgi:hypothetical protein
VNAAAAPADTPAPEAPDGPVPSPAPAANPAAGSAGPAAEAADGTAAASPAPSPGPGPVVGRPPGGTGIGAMATMTSATPPRGVFGPPVATPPPTGYTAPATAFGAAAPPPGKPPRKKLPWMLAAFGTVLVLVGGFVVVNLLDTKDDSTGAQGDPVEKVDSDKDDSDTEGSDTDPDEDADGDDYIDDANEDDTDDDYEQSGDVDPGYLGAWAGEIVNSEGDPTGTFRRLEIYQGYVGDTVAETWNLETDYMCRGTADLVSFGRLMTVDSETTDSVGSSCSPYGEQTLKLQDDGTLIWTYPDYDISAVLEPSDHEIGEDAVPAGYVDAWVPKFDDAEEQGRVEMVITQGPEGTPVVSWERETNSSVCQWEQELIVTDLSDDRMLVSAGRVTYSEPAETCEDGEVESLLLELDGDVVHLTAMPDADEWGSNYLDSVEFVRAG